MFRTNKRRGSYVFVCSLVVSSLGLSGVFAQVKDAPVQIPKSAASVALSPAPLSAAASTSSSVASDNMSLQEYVSLLGKKLRSGTLFADGGAQMVPAVNPAAVTPSPSLVSQSSTRTGAAIAAPTSPSQLGLSEAGNTKPITLEPIKQPAVDRFESWSYNGALLDSTGTPLFGELIKDGRTYQVYSGDTLQDQLQIRSISARYIELVDVVCSASESQKLAQLSARTVRSTPSLARSKHEASSTANSSGAASLASMHKASAVPSATASSAALTVTTNQPPPKCVRRLERRA